MATARIDTVIRQLRRAMLRQVAAGKTDGQLLASFIEQKDEAAFEALVHRHGPMVFGVCRRVIGNHHDAEDAFQATFLVLARKASSVRPREKVANWLHGVALRTAMKVKATIAKRRKREKQVTEMPEPEAVQQDQWRDLQPLLDQELNGLPENYRLPILLCDLEGKTIKEAAQQLGWPQGTLASRLARGRKLLAKRLASRGVALSAGSLAVIVSQNAASAGVPTSLMSSTVKAATMIAAGQAAVAGVVPAQVAVLMEGVLKTMFMTKVIKGVSLMLAFAITTFASGLYMMSANARGPAESDKRPPSNKRTESFAQLDVLDLKDVQDNDALGDKKFAERRVRVTGPLAGVRRLKGSDHYSVVLCVVPSTSEADMWLFSPSFKFGLSAKNELAKLKRGSVLSIEGRYEGRVAEGVREVVTFSDCKIVSVTPPTVIRPGTLPPKSETPKTASPPPK